MATVLENKYIPHTPTVKQADFLRLPETEAFYGGAAGGGKSDALLMGALQFVDLPGYSALLLRRTFADLAMTEAVMNRSHEWLRPWAEGRVPLKDRVRWIAIEKTWLFPSGARVSFGYLDNENDKYRYQGAAFQFIGFDELTQFTDSQYLYLFSRLRKRAGLDIPLRMRGASNPGGVGHEWVKERFVTNQAAKFIPARLSDNPYLDQGSYEQSLNRLDPVTREQLLRGDWVIAEQGRFRREWFRYYHWRGDYLQLERPEADQKFKVYARSDCWVFATCDAAASEKTAADWTCVGVWLVTPGFDLVLLDLVRAHLDVNDIPPVIEQLYHRYKCRYIGIERPRSEGIISACRRRRLTVKALEPNQIGLGGLHDKVTRATDAMIRMQAGQIFLPRSAPWLEAYENELIIFKGDDTTKDDQVDMTAWAAILVAQKVEWGEANDAMPCVAVPGIR